MRERLLRTLSHRWVVTGFLGACLLGGMGHMSFGCSGELHDIDLKAGEDDKVFRLDKAPAATCDAILPPIDFPPMTMRLPFNGLCFAAAAITVR